MSVHQIALCPECNKMPCRPGGRCVNCAVRVARDWETTVAAWAKTARRVLNAPASDEREKWIEMLLSDIAAAREVKS